MRRLPVPSSRSGHDVRAWDNSHRGARRSRVALTPAGAQHESMQQPIDVSQLQPGVPSVARKQTLIVVCRQCSKRGGHLHGPVPEARHRGGEHRNYSDGCLVERRQPGRGPSTRQPVGVGDSSRRASDSAIRRPLTISAHQAHGLVPSLTFPRTST